VTIATSPRDHDWAVASTCPADLARLSSADPARELLTRENAWGRVRLTLPPGRRGSCFWLVGPSGSDRAAWVARAPFRLAENAAGVVLRELVRATRQGERSGRSTRAAAELLRSEV